MNANIFGEHITEEFYRKPTKAEARGGTSRSRAMEDIPEKEGYAIVYKAFSAPKGFYYSKRVLD